MKSEYLANAALASNVNRAVTRQSVNGWTVGQHAFAPGIVRQYRKPTLLQRAVKSIAKWL